MVHNAIMLVKNQLMLDHHVFIFGLNQLCIIDEQVNFHNDMLVQIVV
jgi:hypothetical protein